MATLSTTTLSLSTGAAPAFTACAVAGDEARIDERAFAVFKNASAGSLDVVADVPGNMETGDALPNKTYAVAASGERWIPLDEVYRGPNGRAVFTYPGGATSLSVAVVRR